MRFLFFAVVGAVVGSSTMEQLDNLVHLLIGLASLLTLATGWLWWVVKQNVPTRKEHDVLTQRVSSMEDTVKNLPDIEQLHELKIELTETTGEMQALRATLDGRNMLVDRLNRVVERLEDHALNNARP